MSAPWEQFQKTAVKQEKEAKPWEEFSLTESVNQGSEQSTFQEPEMAVSHNATNNRPQSSLEDFLVGKENNFTADEFLRQANPIGAAEGVASVLTGMGSFAPGAAMGTAEAIKGALEGNPLEGLQSGKHEMERFMESFTYQPRTPGGQKIAQLAGMPFEEAHKGIEGIVTSLGGDETAVEASQFLFDLSLLGVPMALKAVNKLRTGKKLQAKEAAELKKAIEDRGKVKDIQLPRVSPDVLDSIIERTKEIPDKPLDRPTAKVESNQKIVDKLIEVAEDRPAGARKNNYLKAAQTVADWAVDAKEADHSAISKRKGKTRELIEELAEEREKVEPNEPQPVPATEPAPVEGEAQTKTTQDLVDETPVKEAPHPADRFRKEAEIETKQRIQEAREKRQAEKEEQAAAEARAKQEKLRREVEEERNRPKTPEEKVKDTFSKLKRTKKLGDALEVVKESTENKSYIAIAERIKDIVKDADFGVIERDQVDRNSITDPLLSIASGLHTIDKSTGRPSVFIAGDSIRNNPKVIDTTMHEATHAASVKKVKDGMLGKDPEAAKVVGKMRKLQKTVQDGIGTMSQESKDAISPGTLQILQVALNNPKEFITYGFTHEGFQNILKNIKLEGGQNAFTRFVENMRELLGIGKEEHNALAELIDLTDQLIDGRGEVKAEGLKNIEGDIRKAQKTGGRSVEDLKGLYAQWKDSYVKKTNAAREKPVEANDIGVFDDNFKVFKTREEALEYGAVNGLDRDVFTDPLTGESYFEPVVRGLEESNRWSENPDLPGNLTDIIKDDLPSRQDLGDLRPEDYADGFDVLDRSFEIVETAPESLSQGELVDVKITAKKLRELKNEAQRTGKSIDELLSSFEVSPETIENVKRSLADLEKLEESIRAADPLVEGILNPTGKVIPGGARKTRRGYVEEIKTPDELEKAAHNADKLKPVGTVGAAHDMVEIRLDRFERFGKTIKEAFYDKWTKLETLADRETRAAKKELKKDLKGFDKTSRERMSIAAHALQENGPQLLKRMGLDVIKLGDLTAAERGLIQKYQGKLADLHKRINYVRSHIGLEPLGKIDNYFSWAHKLNEMVDARVIENTTSMNLSHYSAQSKNFNGSFFPYAQTRTSRPKAIELDIFSGYERYHSKAVKELYVNPIAAQAKKIANSKRNGRQLIETNPELAKLLMKWSDEILGIDRLASTFASEFPKIFRGINKIASNIGVAILFGTVSTAVKQTTAAIGAYAETSLPDVVAGAAKTFSDSPFNKEMSTARMKSNLLDIRTMDLMIGEIAKNISEKGVKGIKDSAAILAAAPMGFIDGITAEIGWNAGYRYAKRKLKLEEEAAIQWADDIVNRTQGVGIRGAVSPIQANALTKWGTLMQTFAINDFNYIARNLLGIRNPNIKKTAQVKKVLKYIGASAVINSLFQLIGFDAPKPSPIDKHRETRRDGGTEQEALGQALLEFVEVVPLVGGAIKYRSSLFGPGGELAGDVPEALGVVFKSLDWGNMSRAEKQNAGLLLATTLGQVYGVPMTNQIKKSVKAAIRGGNPYEVIMGLYIKKHKQGSSGLPKLPGLKELPELPEP